MTRESNLWSRLREELRGRNCHAVRIENTVELGTPDVNLRFWTANQDMWIELKTVEAPKRAITPVRVEHFTPEQRRFLIDRHKVGGLGFVIIQVSDELFLLSGAYAAVYLGTVPLDVLRLKSLWHGQRINELADYLQNIC